MLPRIYLSTAEWYDDGHDLKVKDNIFNLQSNQIAVDSNAENILIQNILQVSQIYPSEIFYSSILT